MLHMTKSLKNKNKSHIFFLKNKIHGLFYFILFLVCILDLIIGLLNP
jgi:hypothetical protein